MNLNFNFFLTWNIFPVMVYIMEQKKNIISHIRNVSLFLLGILLIFFPVVFTSISTNPLILTKMTLMGIVVFVLLLLFCALTIIDRSVKIRKTSFDIPVILLLLFVFLSAFFSVNRVDAIIGFVPFLFAGLIYFLIVNFAKDKGSLLFLTFSLILGGVLSSALAILTFFKIYILPVPATHIQNFSPLGSLLDQAIYLTIAFLIAFYSTWKLVRASGWPKLKKDLQSQEISESVIPVSRSTPQILAFGASALIILMGSIVTIYSLFKVENPLILPFETGFQTAFAEISLDAGRIAKGFLFGSGFGTYSVDFSRWKQVAFNQYPDLWNLTFFRSSSFVLELLATTGVLGISAFIFILIKALREIKRNNKNNIALSLLAFFIISLVLPLGFVNQTLLFIILGLFAGFQGLKKEHENRFFDIELQVVAFKKGLISIDTPTKSEKSLILPSLLTIVIVFAVAVLGYFSFNYVASDITFQKSLTPGTQNNASFIYENQAKAIAKFPYRDGFYRVFSQTNLAIANALASQQVNEKTPNASVQDNITRLIQQSIDAARTATNLSPQNHLNWQNLASIYRSLIGFGQNAEVFAIRTSQQAIILNPKNPQGYISLGGIYYQLQQWDNAQNQFQIAISLKPDFANSYYNLGHALEQKGDLQNAQAQYEIVKRLVVNDQKSLDQITAEIAALQDKIQTNSNATNTNLDSETPLTIDNPPAVLPTRTPQVEIPAPNVATQSSR